MPRLTFLIKSSGKAKQSFLGQLLDDYDPEANKDDEHEHDLKLIGAMMLAGENSSMVIFTPSEPRELTELPYSWC